MRDDLIHFDSILSSEIAIIYEESIPTGSQIDLGFSHVDHAVSFNHRLENQSQVKQSYR